MAAGVFKNNNMYRIIPGKTLPTEFKIRVNPEQSKVLQEHLFQFRFKWLSGDTDVKNLDAPFIYLEKGRILYDKERAEVSFNKDKLKRIQFEDYFEPITSSTPTSTSVSSKLKELLEGMTQEEFDKSWEEIKNLRLVGPTIEEYLKMK